MRNFALDRSKNETHDTKNMLCAKRTENAAKLDVGICYLPIIRGWTTGPYWIVSYDEGLGYALVIGGQPTIKTENGCKTGQFLYNGGLWIFTRNSVRDNDLVEKVRNIARQKGLDITVLNDIDQTNCQY